MDAEPEGMRDETRDEAAEKTAGQMDIDGSTLLGQPEDDIDRPAGLQISHLASIYTRERPVLILVGPEKHQFFVHRGLLAAKSPFFRAMFKECWDGNKEEIELPEVCADGFGIVVEWMYSCHLPDREELYPKDKPNRWHNVLHAYKAADVLMIAELQNEIVTTEAAVLTQRHLFWKCGRLAKLSSVDLCHTKYYHFVLKSVTASLMSNLAQQPDKWDEEIKSVEDNPRVLADLLTSVRMYLQKPWKDFMKGDLTEFLV